MFSDVPPDDMRAPAALARRVREQSALYRFTDRLYRARTLDQIYAAALDAIEEALDCRRSAILRFDGVGAMRSAAWRRLSEASRRVVEGHSPWRPGDRASEPLCIEDILTSDQPQPLKTAIAAEGIRALAFVPLASADEVIGEFKVYYETPRSFTAAERAVALSIARQLAFAIERHVAELEARKLIAIVTSSDDAIIAKDLDGTITSWNAGAARLFGYLAEEIIGKSVLVLIPPDRHSEEPSILARIRAGERVDHYETVRRRKDGSLVDISLTVSPVKDLAGRIVGASKIARDISEHRRAQERQTLLLREMNHRVKNLFAVASSIVNLSAATASDVEHLASSVSARLLALARAHALTMPMTPDSGEAGHLVEEASLHALTAAILAPYGEGDGQGGQSRFSIIGADMPLRRDAITPFSLLIHEFATNAAKYGALSTPDGRVEIASSLEDGRLLFAWKETGGPAVAPTDKEGFGSRLVHVAARQLGRLERRWSTAGMEIDLTIEADKFAA